MRGRAARCDHDRLGGHDRLVAFRRADSHRVRVDDARAALDQRNVVAGKLISENALFAFDDDLRAPADVVERDLVLDPVRLSVEPALTETGEVQDRLTHRLRRNRPSVDTDAADASPLLDDRRAEAELRGL